MFRREKNWTEVRSSSIQRAENGKEEAGKKIFSSWSFSSFWTGIYEYYLRLRAGIDWDVRTFDDITNIEFVAKLFTSCSSIQHCDCHCSSHLSTFSLFSGTWNEIKYNDNIDLVVQQPKSIDERRRWWGWWQKWEEEENCSIGCNNNETRSQCGVSSVSY